MSLSDQATQRPQHRTRAQKDSHSNNDDDVQRNPRTARRRQQRRLALAQKLGFEDVSADSASVSEAPPRAVASTDDAVHQVSEPVVHLTAQRKFPHAKGFTYREIT